MRYKIIILSLIAVLSYKVCGVNASELFGKISTNPKDANVITPKPNEGVNTIKEEVVHQGSGSGGFLIKNEINKVSVVQIPDKIDGLLAEESNVDDVMVLGISHIADYNLIRGKDMRVYLVEGKYKKHLKSLYDLRKYSGRIIYNVSEEELMSYETRDFLDGALIREKGMVKIYLIENAKAKYIKNLNELRENYRGREIHNLDSDKILIYF